MSALIDDSLVCLQGFATERQYANNGCLFLQGDSPDGCHLIISGQVETFCFDSDVQAEAVLQTYSAGEVIGSIGVIDGSLRKVTAKAKAEVMTYFIATEDVERMKVENLKAYETFIRLSTNTLAKKFRELQDQACTSAISSCVSPVVNEVVDRANAAQQIFSSWPEHKISELLTDIAHSVNAESFSLAQQSVDETGMGVVEHKVQKIQIGTLDVLRSLDLSTSDQVALEAPGVESMVMPMGVVFAIIPVTNPVETIVFKALSAMKARNSIIISSHRKARGIGDRTVAIIREVLTRHGAPADLVQAPSLPANRKLTQAFMSHEKVHFILATGGPSMVKSAYRSGTPAIGVGKGNAPVWVCSDANLAVVARTVVGSKSFDNGVVCGSENNLIIDTDVAADFIDHLESEGAAVLTPTEVGTLLNTVFENGSLTPELIGQSAAKICNLAGIQRHYPIKLIVAEVTSGNAISPLIREKLAPILSLTRVEDDEQAIFVARSILNIEGRGHTAMIHTQNKTRIHEFAKAVEVSRVLVNSPGTQGCIGACNGLQLSWTLGCGTFGGSSTSDNVTYRHLQNQKRIAYSQTSIASFGTTIRDKVKNSFVSKRRGVSNARVVSI
ncbi:Aldehyde-alcohol dehydrogenase [Thalassocella blandensis]|nr:Aldehyde-alcohol dehydrogenase [Thalassocella blandensis]